MKYVLAKLDEIISVSLSPQNLRKQKNVPAFLKRCQRECIAETERVKKLFQEEVYNSSDEWRNKLYIRNQQLGITRLSDLLFDQLLPETVSGGSTIRKNKHSIEAMEQFQGLLDGLLNFMATHFNKYFDSELVLPKTQQKIAVAQLQQQIGLVQHSLLEMQTGEELHHIICRPFTENTGTDYKLSSQRLNFLEQLQQKIIRASKREGPDIFAVLYYLNFNCRDMFALIILQFAATAKRLPGRKERYEFYALQLKTINQLPVKPGLAFKPAHPSLKEQVLNWLSEELNFLKNCSLPSLAVLNHPDEELPGTAKVETSLTVAHLSLGLKLLMDANVIINKNSSEVMRMVARNFRTARMDSISESSLRNKSYHIESATLDGMKDLIIRLMNLIRTY